MARKGRRAAKGKAGDLAKQPGHRAEAPAKGSGAGAKGRTEGFYAELFTPEELADLTQAVAEPSLEDEIDLLRVAIRRGAAADASLETISRSVQRLAQALKVERELRGQGIRNLEEALARVLDELGNELGTG